MSHDKSRKLFEISDESLSRLQADLVQGFSERASQSFADRQTNPVDVTPRMIGDIEQAYIVTWMNMKNRFGGKAVNYNYM